MCQSISNQGQKNVWQWRSSQHRVPVEDSGKPTRRAYLQHIRRRWNIQHSIDSSFLSFRDCLSLYFVKKGLVITKYCFYQIFCKIFLIFLYKYPPGWSIWGWWVFIVFYCNTEIFWNKKLMEPFLSNLLDEELMLKTYYRIIESTCGSISPF